MKDIFYTIFKYKDKKSPDTLGLYPERVHTKAFPERRYLWSSRMLVIIATISISINMILASLFIILIPQKTSSPRLLHVNEDFYNLEQTQPAEKNVLATDILAEADIIDYITLRYQITQNKEADLRRWQNNSRFYWLSSSAVYKEFLETEEEYTHSQRANGLTRQVEVQWVKPVSYGLWQAQFITYDSIPGKPTVVNLWRATIRGRYFPLNYKSKDDMIKNPYGFVITSFYLSYAGKKQ